jgi:hypothetical protein
MSITYPIGYPTGNPMHNPKGYPNRGRIARPVSARVVSSPVLIGETSHHVVTYVTRATHDAMMLEAIR